MGLFENFPYTNFHRLNLDWVLQEMKRVVAEWTETKTEWADTEIEWQNLYNYVHDYFDNLDLSAEVRQELNTMLANGQLNYLIQQTLIGMADDLQNQINVLSGRVDSFASLPPGSTAGNAELLDIRVAADGQTYPSAGDAVRAQITTLTTAVNNLNKLIALDYNYFGFVQGYIRNNDGSIGADNATCASNFIYAETDKLFVVIAAGYQIGKLAEYTGTAPGQFVSVTTGLSLQTLAEFTVIPGRFYRIQVTKTDMTNFTPSDIDGIIYGYFRLFDTVTEIWKSSNLYNGDIVSGRYINESGSIGTDGNLCYINAFFPVSEGDTFVAGKGQNTVVQMRFVTAYDATKTAVAAAGANGHWRYRVPAGISFVRFSFYLADVNAADFRLSSSYIYPKAYETPYDKIVPLEYSFVKKLKEEPLTALPADFLNRAAYQTLGALSKPYICLVSDDGDEDLISYTMPMIYAKSVPCTWAVMSNSEVFTSVNASANIAALIDSVANHGCAISQHGSTNWTEYDERELRQFFATEKAYLDSIGLPATSAVMPSHYTSYLIAAIAGGLYGVCRTGLYGQNADGDTFEDLVKAYPNYTCGARTNLYALTSQNLANISTPDAKNVIDYVNAHNGVAIFYFHENSLDATKKQRIEDAIDYGKSLGITFITLDEMQTIV